MNDRDRQWKFVRSIQSDSGSSAVLKQSLNVKTGRRRRLHSEEDIYQDEDVNHTNTTYFSRQGDTEYVALEIE